MDDDGASDQRQKELSVSLAASSMINGSDMITKEAYKANLKRIQEVKEMVQRLETNNESAHKNFLVDQLEKRAKDGREAEIMLARLRSQPGPPETVQFNSNVPSDRSEVILPTTATLVEVPESHPSYPSPMTTSYPQTIYQGPAPQYQWSLPGQVRQVQSYDPSALGHYTPSSAIRHPQHGIAPRSQTPVDGQTVWYTAQNVPPQSRVSIPTQFQQPSQSWSSYPYPVITMPAADSVSAQRYHPPPQGWTRTTSVPNTTSTGSSSTTYRDSRFPIQSTASRPTVTAHDRLHNPPAVAPVSQVQAPLHVVPTPPEKFSIGQSLPIQPYPKLAESQSQHLPVTVSKPIAISELQRSGKSPQQPHQQQRQPQVPSQPPQPPTQSRQHSQPSQPRLKSPPQPLPQSRQQLQQPQELAAREPLQPPQALLRANPQATDPILATSVSQPHSQPSQLPQSTTAQGQASQRVAHPRVDQATFIKLFQIAVQRGVSYLKVFFPQAKASGISDDWFRAAIKSLPRGVWESVMAQVNQSGPTLDVPSSTNAPRQQISTISDPNVLMTGARPPPTPTPVVQTTPSTQQATKPSTSAEGKTAPFTLGREYAVQLQYYAEQAAKSALSTQVASTSTLAGDNSQTQEAVIASTRNLSEAQTSVRTPKDANKSTLARDILRSLGKTVPKPPEGEPADDANSPEDDQLPKVNAIQPTSHIASPKAPTFPLETGFVPVNPPSIPLATQNMPTKSHNVDLPKLPTAKSVWKDERKQTAAIKGPVMIDLTLEDSDAPVDGNEQETGSTFPIQTSTCAATPSRPASPTNTTNRTLLLENLSLEERRVDITANGGNADVRMYSPPSSLATVENMEPELLRPSLDGTELVSSSLEPLPHEASEHLLHGQLPLFLPSPPMSPAHTEPPETDPEMTNEEGKSSPSLKRYSVDANEMETDTELLMPHIRKRRKQQVYVFVPPAPSYVRKAIEKMKEHAMEKDIDSDMEGRGEDEEFQYSHLEQLLVEESKSQLLERQCRWLNCGVVLNCATSLLAHLKNHAREEDSQAPFLCRWASCQRQFDTVQQRDIHLERHTTRPLPCPFAGCNEQFAKPVEVMQHEVQHQEAERGEPLMRKQTYRPVVPAIPARLGPPPRQLPSHCVIPRRVVRCRISADRHATMGPWILWNIFSPVDLNARKQNVPMRGRPIRQTINYDIDSSDPRRDDYDFLLALSSYPAKHPQLDDLDSTLITMSAAQGLTLWGSGSAVNDATGTATAEEGTSVDAAAEEDAIEGKSDGGEAVGAAREGRPEERQSVVAVEEDAVERMLDV